MSEIVQVVANMNSLQYKIDQLNILYNKRKTKNRTRFINHLKFEIAEVFMGMHKSMHDISNIYKSFNETECDLYLLNKKIKLDNYNLKERNTYLENICSKYLDNDCNSPQFILDMFSK